MSAKLTPEQLDELRDILKRDPPGSIADADFDSALEEVSAVNPNLAAAWVMTFDESQVEVPKEKLPAEVTAKRARRVALFNRTAQRATTSELGEEDTPVGYLPDQRRIMLIVFGFVILVVLAVVVYWWVGTRTSSIIGPVVEAVEQPEPTVLPVIPAAPPVIEVPAPPAPIVVEEPAPPPTNVFTNQTPAAAPTPAPVPVSVSDTELAAPLILPISTFDAGSPNEAINAVLYREEPAQGVSSGLNPVFVHVSDVGTGGPINLMGTSQASPGVAGGLAPSNSSNAGAATNLLLYSDRPTAANAGQAVVFTDANRGNASGDVFAFNLQEPASTQALEIYNNGGGRTNEAVMQPGGLIREAYPVNSMAAGVSFDSPADALRAAGIPDSANAALQTPGPASDLILTPPAAQQTAGSTSANSTTSAGSSGLGFSGPLPTTQVEFDAFLGDVPLSSDPVDQMLVSTTSTEFVTGERVPARLVTSATILDGVPAPVIAETFGTWCSIGPCPQVTFVGLASLMGPNRVVINFHTMITDGAARSFTGIALSQDYGTSIPATIRDETPALAPNLMRASLGGVSAYAQAMLNQTQTTFLPDGGTIEQTIMPSLEALIAGNMASALQLPQSTQTVVRLAELDPGLDIIVAVGLSY